MLLEVPRQPIETLIDSESLSNDTKLTSLEKYREQVQDAYDIQCVRYKEI